MLRQQPGQRRPGQRMIVDEQDSFGHRSMTYRQTTAATRIVGVSKLSGLDGRASGA
jgi:hypothetical protein